MKTPGRILIILAAFAFVMGITYMVVNANSTSGAAPALGGGTDGFPQRDAQGPAFANGEGPDVDAQGGGWIFSLVTNVGVIAIVVALVAVPKRLIHRRPLPVWVK